MTANKSTILVVIGMLVFTMVFASWVGADGGDPAPADPTAELICPKMSDKPCDASGTMASGNPATALKKAEERCQTEFSKCVETQGTEATKNYEKCTGSVAPKCTYSSETDSEQCVGDAATDCTTKNGLTTCTVDGHYNRTTYACDKVATPTVAPL